MDLDFRNAYGEKIAKIGPVYPEILDETHQFFGRVVADIHKWALSTLELLVWISRTFCTT